MSEQCFTLQRRIPDEWPRLYEAAGTALEDNAIDPTHNEGLWALGTEIQGLDMTAVDINLYYALGQGICELAQILTDSETRDVIIQDGVDILLSKSAELDGGISALASARVVSQAFSPEIVRAYEALTPEVQLIGNFLSVARSQRLMKQSRDNLGAYGPEDDPMLLREQISMLANSRAPHLRLLLNEPVTGGTTKVLSKILAARSDDQFDSHPDMDTRQFLRDPSIQRVAQRCCALLVDDILYNREYLAVSYYDVTFIDPAPTRPASVSHESSYGWRGKSYYVRDESIVCPAAHVNGTVPLVLGMVIDMIDQACEQFGRSNPKCGLTFSGETL